MNEMQEIILKVSKEDFDNIEKQLVFKGTTENLHFAVIEAVFTESPKFKLESIKGELI